MLMECILSVPLLLPASPNLNRHYRPVVPWGPHRKKKKDGWNCPFYSDVLLWGFTLLHYEANPSSSCQTKRCFMRLCYLHTLLYGGCKENPDVNKREWKELRRVRVPCLIRCNVLGLILRSFRTRSVTGADSRWQRSFVTYRAVYLSVETCLFWCAWLFEEPATLCAGKGAKHVWGSCMFVLVMVCLCECVSLCVYAANGGLIW